MTSEKTVLAALEGAYRVSYSSLLDRIRATGQEPLGMLLVLDRLERFGIIRRLDRQGRPWSHEYGFKRSPLYIELRARL